ncbi:hypothetical protein [Thiohalocapsa sp. ML1]|uniref:hypothetical protein n=1 Tax=Thiohalocapsa sp. ML1 TaxID=1431688 RepID=UPI0012E34143|nr:hypothetical protein [Thiohalocapsa sp. ML1]
MSDIQRFEDLIEELRAIDNGLARKGVRVDALTQTIEKLERHQHNVEALENNIAAIRSEIIKPVQAELIENKKAGKFSILGFWIGALSIVVAIGSLIYTTFFVAPTTHQEIVHRIEQTRAAMNEFDRQFTESLRGLQSFPDDYEGLLVKAFSEAGERSEMILALNGSISPDQETRTTYAGLVFYNLKRGRYHDKALDFYLDHFDALLEYGREDEIFTGAQALALIDPQLLGSRKRQIEEFFSKIFGKQGWCKTSNVYTQIARALHHEAPANTLPKNLMNSNGLFDCEQFNNYWVKQTSG